MAIREHSLDATPRHPARPRKGHGRAPEYRKLTRADAKALTRHLLRLSPPDRQMRFLGSVRDEAIKAHVARMDWSKTLIVGAYVRGTLRGVAELVRVEILPHPSAEAALSVETGHQNAGIGSELLRRSLMLARNRYIDRVHMMCLSDNTKMQRIAHKFEADLLRQPGEVEGRIWPLWPSYLSLMEEAMSDGNAFFKAVFKP